MDSSRTTARDDAGRPPAAPDSISFYRSHHRVLCTIAGLDPTGGAGAAADLRAFAAHGAAGAAVVTAVAVQDAEGVRAIHPLPAEHVAAQLRAALAAGPAALKTGMLASAATIRAVAGALAGTDAPLVVDPVLEASAGGRLLPAEDLPALAAALGPRADLLTPNRPEAEALLGRSIEVGGEQEAAEALREAGWAAVLLKGGHGTGEAATDVLADAEGLVTFVRPRLEGVSVRGTGCALSAAIAARRGAGNPLREAVRGAGDWLHGRLLEAQATGAAHLR